MVARVVPQSARRRHAESRKPDLWGWAARPKAPVLLSFQLRWCCGDRKVQLVEQSYVEREWLLCRDLSWLSCLGGAEASLAGLGGTRSKPRRR